jgi:hypothetical protein
MTARSYLFVSANIAVIRRACFFVFFIDQPTAGAPLAGAQPNPKQMTESEIPGIGMDAHK